MATGSGSKEKMLEGGSKGSKSSNNQRRIQREEYEHSMWFIRATGVKLFFQQNFLYLLKLAPFYNAFLLPKEKRYHCINFRMQVGVC